MGRVWAVVALTLLMAGCLPEQPPQTVESGTQSVAPAQTLGALPVESGTPPSEVDSDTLLAELMAMAAEPEKHEMNVRAYEINDALAARGGTLLEPFLALLGSEESSGATRLFVLRCANGTLGPSYLPQLEGMLDSEDWSTRSCAVTLIGSIAGEESVSVLKKLYEDIDERIRFSALSGLAIQAGDPYRSELAALYFEETTSEAWRSEIVRVLLIMPQPSDREVLEAVLVSETTEPQGRDWVAMVLANIGAPESIPAFERSLEMDKRESFQSMAQAAIDVIRETAERSATAQPEEVQAQ